MKSHRLHDSYKISGKTVEVEKREAYILKNCLAYCIPFIEMSFIVNSADTA